MTNIIVGCHLVLFSAPDTQAHPMLADGMQDRKGAGWERDAVGSPWLHLGASPCLLQTADCNSLTLLCKVLFDTPPRVFLSEMYKGAEGSRLLKSDKLL